MTDRKQHLNWCKERAAEYVAAGDLTSAVSSMISDLNKHDETRVDPMLGMMGMLEISRGGAAVQRWIEGFN